MYFFLILNLVTCSIQRWSGMCSEVSVTGSDRCNSLGVYTLTNTVNDRRPIYVNAVKERTMYYDTAGWVC